jgi:hypothetical protein
VLWYCNIAGEGRAIHKLIVSKDEMKEKQNILPKVKSVISK